MCGPASVRLLRANCPNNPEAEATMAGIIQRDFRARHKTSGTHLTQIKALWELIYALSWEVHQGFETDTIMHLQTRHLRITHTHTQKSVFWFACEVSRFGLTPDHMPHCGSYIVKHIRTAPVSQEVWMITYHSWMAFGACPPFLPCYAKESGACPYVSS